MAYHLLAWKIIFQQVFVKKEIHSTLILLNPSPIGNGCPDRRGNRLLIEPPKRDRAQKTGEKDVSRHSKA
jgi:hypothetical protein